jgi:hypothetical protein
MGHAQWVKYSTPGIPRTLNQILVADTELLDYVCLENERSVRRFR